MGVALDRIRVWAENLTERLGPHRRAHRAWIPPRPYGEFVHIAEAHVKAPAAGRRLGDAVRDGPIDIIMLTHNRLEHLAATIDALEERTPEPYRLTVVDNASGPDVRNWLEANRHRMHQLILRPTNEHVPAFSHGIAATLSDPFVVTDPDVIVPKLEPSWLARMLDLVERYPDFGLISVGLDPVNRPAVLEPASIDPRAVVNGELVEAGTGTVFQFIHRHALVTNYRSDGQACTNVRRTGYRVGWALNVRALHLGWDDYRLYPGHLLSKPDEYGIYREVDMVPQPPSLEELALAAPVVSTTRGAGIPDAAVIEVAWDGPVVGAVLPDVVALDSLAGERMPFGDAAAAAVVLKLPPEGRAQQLVREGTRVATTLVLALAPLTTFDGRTAAQLAPPGWRGREAAAVGSVPLAMAAAAVGDPGLVKQLQTSTGQDRERWLELFARAAFGPGDLRLWIWEREQGGPAPERVDVGRVAPWRPGFLEAPEAQRPGLLGRIRRRIDLRDRADVWLGRLRRRTTTQRESEWSS